MIEGIEARQFAEQLAKRLAESIPLKAHNSSSFRDWTLAVYDSLREAKPSNWTISPEDRPYAGEYLCDFMLFEPKYGCRVACESQWQHWRSVHLKDLEWAFDKLRGVKADVKLFIFEGDKEHLQAVVDTYLLDYAHLGVDEVYVAMRWEKPRFVISIWSPQTHGVQTGPIVFAEV